MARIDDAAKITQQRRAMFHHMRGAQASALDEMEARFLPWVTAKLKAGEYLGWFAVAEDGTIAAGAGLWLMEWPPHMLGRADRRGYLLNVYTGVGFRRRGLAKVLVEVAVDWCRTNGIDVMVLHASSAGRSMYEQLGFAATNEMRMVVE
jgi:GNAT superfamily N-acetyltransferase